MKKTIIVLFTTTLLGSSIFSTQATENYSLSENNSLSENRFFSENDPSSGNNIPSGDDSLNDLFSSNNIFSESDLFPESGFTSHNSVKQDIDSFVSVRQNQDLYQLDKNTLVSAFDKKWCAEILTDALISIDNKFVKEEEKKQQTNKRKNEEQTNDQNKDKKLKPASRAEIKRSKRISAINTVYETIKESNVIDFDKFFDLVNETILVEKVKFSGRYHFFQFMKATICKDRLPNGTTWENLLKTYN